MSRIERLCLSSLVRSGRGADVRCILTVAFLLIWIGSEIMRGEAPLIFPILFLVNLITCLYAYRDRVLLRLLNVGPLSREDKRD